MTSTDGETAELTNEKQTEGHEERSRQQTERGAQWNMDLRKQGWKSALTKWRRSCNKLQSVLVKSDYDAIKLQQDALEGCMDKQIKMLEKHAQV